MLKVTEIILVVLCADGSLFDGDNAVTVHSDDQTTASSVNATADSTTIFAPAKGNDQLRSLIIF